MPRKPRSDTHLLDRSGSLLGGRYRVLELLGVGAMGSVWTAEHLALKRNVVVKFHEEAFTGSEAHVALRRFLREASTLSSVCHRNVALCHEVGRTDEGDPYLILELLHGETLARRVVREGALPVAQALRIAIEVASGMEAVHSAGILHRDIKPENIFLARQEDEIVPKLLDFGLARTTDPKKRITKAGRIVGTPGYMAPEQGRGSSELDHRVDIYALGVTLYEMLCGHLPFAGETANDLVIAAVTEDPPRLSLRRSTLGGPICDTVMRAIQRDRERRYPDMRSMRVALAALLEDEALVTGSRELAFPPTLETGGTTVREERKLPPARTTRSPR